MDFESMLVLIQFYKYRNQHSSPVTITVNVNVKEIFCTNCTNYIQAHQTNQDKHSHAHEGDAIIYFILIFWK